MNKKTYIFLKDESKRIKTDIDFELKKKVVDQNKVRYLIILLENTTNKMENIINSMY